jgi:AAA15 family ATPase/GTPase
MRLFSFQIKNFKSIIDTGECKLSELDNIVILAGQNEAGKSAVLEALNFFKNGPSEDFERLQIRLDTNETEVICKFIVDKDDLRSCMVVLTDDKLDKFLKKNSNISFVRRHEKGKPKNNIVLTDESEILIKTLISENLNKEEGSVEGETLEDSPSPTNPTPISTRTLPKTLVEVTNELIKAIPPFTLYTSFTDLLPTEIIVSELSKNNAVKDFEKVFSINLTEFAQITDPRDRKIMKDKIEKSATDDFNQSWTQTITSLREDEKYSFSIDISDAEPKKYFFMIEGRDHKPLYLEQKSLGFRWFSAFHLRLRSMMKDVTPNGVQTKNNTRFVLLIDEPGQNLHDIAQRDVKKILEETAGKNIQIIYSTHNPNLIGTEGKEFTRIRLVSNDENRGTKVENIAQFISNTNRGSLDALSPIVTAMGLVNAQSIFETDKLNVVVEGITDHYYLSAFKIKINNDENIRFIPACGVDNVKHLVSILIGWGFDFKAVMDDDRKQGRKAYNILKINFFEDDDDLAHKHIYKIKNCIGIEDVFLPSDFENYVLGRKRTIAEKSMANSEIVKESGKEMYARMFLEKVENGEKIDLSKGTQKKIEEIFTWIINRLEIEEMNLDQGTQDSFSS